MQKQIELVHFQITKNCNLRCWFCGQWGKKGFFADDNGEEVSLEKWLEIINDLEVYGKKVGRLPDVMLWGGEPLVSNKFTTVLKVLNEKGFKVGIVTNGYFIDKFINEINKAVSVLYVSIDGLQPIHDAIRGNGVYQKVISNLKLLNSQVKIRVMSVITKNLLNSLVEFTNELKTLNVDKLILQDMIGLTSCEVVEYKNALKRYDIDATAIDGWLSNPEIYRAEVLKIINSLPNFVEYLPHGAVNDRSCLSPFKHIHVTWNGNLTFCTDFYDFNFGNVNNGNIVDLFSGEVAEKFRSALSSCDLPTCKHCSWKLSKEFYFN